MTDVETRQDPLAVKMQSMMEDMKFVGEVHANVMVATMLRTVLEYLEAKYGDMNTEVHEMSNEHAIAMLTVIRDVWYAPGARAAVLHNIWNQNDGYGPTGHTPPQGQDWSGIRDSSYGATLKMYNEAFWEHVRLFSGKVGSSPGR
jgi:hypothetical protein